MWERGCIISQAHQPSRCIIHCCFQWLHCIGPCFTVTCEVRSGQLIKIPNLLLFPWREDKCTVFATKGAKLPRYPSALPTGSFCIRPRYRFIFLPYFYTRPILLTEQNGPVYTYTIDGFRQQQYQLRKYIRELQQDGL